MQSVSNIEIKRPIWQTIAIFVLSFWLSASLILDWVIMPTLYVSGMMTASGFATAGYLIFWNFNRIELLSAAIILTSFLVLTKTKQMTTNRRNSLAIVFAVILLAVPAIYTYFLSPHMCATGINLNLFASATEIPATMNILHGGYWVLEAIKLVVGGTLLGWCWKQ
jgi:hypothetical protein